MVVNADGSLYNYSFSDGAIYGRHGKWRDEGGGSITGDLSGHEITLALEGDTLVLSLKGSYGSNVLRLTRIGDKEIPTNVTWLDEEVTFDNAVILDNEYCTVQLLRFYVNADYGSVDKCFEIQVTNNTENYGSVFLHGFLGIEDVNLTQSGESYPAPDKSVKLEFRAYSDGDGSEHVPIESLNQLYQFNGEVTWEVLSDPVDGSRRQLDYQKFPISFESVK